MRRNLSFRRFINYERRQLKVNEAAGFQSYAGTCYHSEQYAEKVLKEKLAELDVTPRRTHDLNELLMTIAYRLGLDTDASDFKAIEKNCADLSDMYHRSRYPDFRWENSIITKRMATRSVRQADEIVAWVRSL